MINKQGWCMRVCVCVCVCVCGGGGGGGGGGGYTTQETISPLIGPCFPPHHKQSLDMLMAEYLDKCNDNDTYHTQWNKTKNWNIVC